MSFFILSAAVVEDVAGGDDEEDSSEEDDNDEEDDDDHDEGGTGLGGEGSSFDDEEEEEAIIAPRRVTNLWKWYTSEVEHSTPPIIIGTVIPKEGINYLGSVDSTWLRTFGFSLGSIVVGVPPPMEINLVVALFCGSCGLAVLALQSSPEFF